MCRKPIDLACMQVDHVIPEQLLGKPVELKSVLQEYGLPEDFDLNSFSNWLPACGECNNRKRGRVLRPTTRIQLELEIAADKADEAAALAARTVGKQQLHRAFNILKRSLESETLAEEAASFLQDMLPLVEFQVENRDPEMSGLPIMLTPGLEVLSEAGGIRVVRGPYGIGGGPSGPDVHPSFRCPTCGAVAWNGARCVFCGEMSDD